jgi:hypothetical protein
MVKFRNEYVTLRELNYTKPIPYLDDAVEVAYVYDDWILEVISPDTFSGAATKRIYG